MKDKKLNDKYNPQDFEEKLYQEWEEKGYFKPNMDKTKESYCIMMPPPNVTGKLHMGHALDGTIQDLLIRFKRMQGYNTLWVPGTDHAALPTEAKIVETMKKEGLKKTDIGREKFLERAWEWTRLYGGTIVSQQRKLGCSCDWSRSRFTMDEGLSKAVYEAFSRLYSRGLIYKGKRMINYCPGCHTSISDAEIEYKEETSHLWYIKYPIIGEDNYVVVATTRPETMLGDTAVTVNPKDERYKNIIGKKIKLPIVGREIPIIADRFVEMEFGTGCVKVTPAHDINDYQSGIEHNLEIIEVFDENLKMKDIVPEYEGMDIYDARKAIVERLEKEGYLLKIEDYTHNVAKCDRCKTTIEPRISDQWFVKMDELAKPAIKAVEEGKVKFIPKKYETTYFNWMKNIKDWCISRQLWWGHRIPAWYCDDCGAITVDRETPTVCSKCGSAHLHRDEDTLDTWFSSALWPFSTLGWPEKTEEFNYFYPTNTLVTGYDIIFFWVARMMFQGKEFTGQRPFKNVLIHGLIRDGEGRKMSKSLGNGVDPMDVIEKYGADALRWFLATGSTPGQDVRFTYDKMDAAWNFINKIWNASRYVIMNLSEDTPSTLPDLDKLTLADQWILSRLNTTVENVTRNFDKFEFGEAGRELYNFIWSDFADWYIEMTKETLNGDGDKAPVQQTLAYVLDQTLRLLQPIMPFVTEAIWQEMPAQAGQDVDFSVTRYPVVHEELTNVAAEKAFKSLQDLIVAVRNIRSEANAPMSTEIDLLIKTADAGLVQIFQDNADYINRFAHPKSLTIGADIVAPDLAMSQVISGAEIYVPLAELIDIDEEIARLSGEVKKFTGEVKRAEGKLGNEKFVNSAPEAVVAAEREKLADWQAKLAATQERLQVLQAAK